MIYLNVFDTVLVASAPEQNVQPGEDDAREAA
jgi:hypothetical protein